MLDPEIVEFFTIVEHFMVDDVIQEKKLDTEEEGLVNFVALYQTGPMCEKCRHHFQEKNGELFAKADDGKDGRSDS